MYEEIVINGVRGKVFEKYKGNIRKVITEEGEVIRYYQSHEPKCLIIKPAKRGYKYVRYTDEKGDNRITSIHQLVARAFIPNPNNYTHIDHINENKLDNRVGNLRWCTAKQNSEFYHNKQTQRIRDYRRSIKKLIKEVRKDKKEIEILKSELLKQTELYDKMHQEKLDKFNKWKSEEMKKIKVLNSNYKGFKDTKDKKFHSVEDMVKAVGKEIVVDGRKFISCGSAAQYIVNNNPGKNKATISKELRRYLQGRRKEWMMYKKHTIGY